MKSVCIPLPDELYDEFKFSAEAKKLKLATFLRDSIYLFFNIDAEKYKVRRSHLNPDKRKRPVGPKRGRGRPRKDSSDMVFAVDTSTMDTAPKSYLAKDGSVPTVRRRPGRPRKDTTVRFIQKILAKPEMLNEVTSWETTEKYLKLYLKDGSVKQIGPLTHDLEGI